MRRAAVTAGGRRAGGVRGEAAGEVLVEWAGLKPPDRAAEKLVRCYGYDAGRILDCCRRADLYPQSALCPCNIHCILVDFISEPAICDFVMITSFSSVQGHYMKIHFCSCVPI